MTHKIKNFDKLVWGILGAATLVIALLIAGGNQIGAQVQETFPGQDGEISAWGQIGITFKQPMQGDTFKNRWKIDPDIPGHITWQGNTLWFTADKAFDSRVTYQFHLLPGGLAADGREVKQEMIIPVHIRQPQVIYLFSGRNDQRELWSISASGGEAHQITSSGGKIYDFAVSRDGNQIVYSATNSQNGSDIWATGRDGSQARLLVNCGPDHCMQAAWSPDGRQILFARAVSAQANANNRSGVWQIDLVSNQVSFLFQGANPSWSPDGNYITITDGKNKLIKVYNLVKGNAIEIKTVSDLVPTWFPDGSRLIYADMQTAGGLPSMVLFQIDLATQHISRFLGDDLDTMEFSMPSISPDEKTLIIGLRILNGGLTKQLWSLDVDGLHKQQLTGDETLTNNGYRWDPCGREVVFQQVPLGDSQAVPRVMIWDAQSHATRILVSQASLPAWLP